MEKAGWGFEASTSWLSPVSKQPESPEKRVISGDGDGLTVVALVVI
jgi:hypothetical protein